MEKKLGAAVWGAGWVAGEHIRAYENNPRCEMVAIGSRKAQSATLEQELYSCPLNYGEKR